MKGCLRITRCALHQRRNKGGNAHNFPFDTLTKVYRDTMYGNHARYKGNPMHPERGQHTATTPVPPSPRSDVTNHVGNIGVMSAAATPLSQWIAELRHPHHPEQQDGDHNHDQDHDEHQHSHGGPSSALSSSRSSEHTRIVRNARAMPEVHGSGSGNGSIGGGDVLVTATTMNDEAMRERLRTHLFSAKKAGKTRGAHSSSAAAAAAPRHSGVQIEVLNLYRSMLREVRKMDDAETRRNLTAFIRSEYDKHRDVPRKDILKIEWQINYGKRKLEDLQAMGKNTKFTMMR
ncbi:Complex 1 protein (LYR family) [Lotmaria passim]